VRAKERPCARFCLPVEIRNIVQKSFTEPGILESNLEIGLKVTKGVASVVVQASEKMPEKRHFLAEKIQRVSEL
jgi:hypothetical protein